MSGGAVSPAYRIGSAASAASVVVDGAARVAALTTTAETAAHALRHVAWSMPLPQQSSGGGEDAMLSHDVAADTAQALTAGPKTSQNARKAATNTRCLCMSPRRLSARPEGRQTTL